MPTTQPPPNTGPLLLIAAGATVLALALLWWASKAAGRSVPQLAGMLLGSAIRGRLGELLKELAAAMGPFRPPRLPPTPASFRRAFLLPGGLGNAVVCDDGAWIELDAPPEPRPDEVRPGTGRRAVARRTINEAYKDRVARAARSAAFTAFGRIDGLEHLTISVMKPMVDPMRGHSFLGCLLSVQIDVDTWQDIVHQNVTSENALKNYPIRFSFDRNFTLRPVQPFPAPEAPSPFASVPLIELDPLAFEELVRQLIERMGYRAALTKVSHDGGVDVEAVNPEPIVGGKRLVQCKRYSHAVGAPVVRDLYGAVTDARASKGVLITTSYFTAEAMKFAEGKPIELIDGDGLRALLARYGVRQPV